MERLSISRMLFANPLPSVSSLLTHSGLIGDGSVFCVHVRVCIDGQYFGVVMTVGDVLWLTVAKVVVGCDFIDIPAYTRVAVVTMK